MSNSLRKSSLFSQVALEHADFPCSFATFQCMSVVFLRAARVGVFATDIGLKLTQVGLRTSFLLSLYIVVFGRAEPNHTVSYFSLSVSVHVPSHFRHQLTCAVSLAV